MAEGRLDRDEGYHDVAGYVRLEGSCACGHSWKVRGAIQITDAVEENDESE